MIQRKMVAICEWCTRQELLDCTSLKVARNDLSDFWWYFYDGRDFCCEECLNNYLKEKREIEKRNN